MGLLGEPDSLRGGHSTHSTGREREESGSHVTFYDLSLEVLSLLYFVGGNSPKASPG